MATSYSNVSTAADLSADIKAIDLASQASTDSGVAYTIALAAGATLTEAADIYAVNLKGKDTLTLDGDGAILNGANAHRGLFVYQGTMTVNKLTIENAVAKGGAGGGSAGGGAGLGGGLFLANDAAHGAGAAKVTLNNVAFVADSAVGGGGAGGLSYGGGGGMGGAGGGAAFGGGGGGIGGAGGGADGEPGLVLGRRERRKWRLRVSHAPREWSRLPVHSRWGKQWRRRWGWRGRVLRLSPTVHGRRRRGR